MTSVTDPHLGGRQIEARLCSQGEEANLSSRLVINILEGMKVRPINTGGLALL